MNIFYAISDPFSGGIFDKYFLYRPSIHATPRSPEDDRSLQAVTATKPPDQAICPPAQKYIQFGLIVFC